MTDQAYKYISENHSWDKLICEMKNIYSAICEDV